MIFTKTDAVTLEIPRAALEAIFDECDSYNVDETGGRILGTYEKSGRQLHISISGVIEPGPNAQRTQTYFKQDGEYQEKVFREVEESIPAIEHLGNWHTHHVNGLPHLSGGDIETYRRIVEHAKHNTDFFYALLVTEKKPGQTGLQRYTFKNYLMRRGDAKIYEIPANAVTLLDAPLVWPLSDTQSQHERSPRSIAAYARSSDGFAKHDLVQDQDVISQFFPKMKMLRSKELGIHWRGLITLADGSDIEAVVLRDNEAPYEYGVTLRNLPKPLSPVLEPLGKVSFPSGRAALVTTERACNSQLVSSISVRKRRRRLWMF